MVARGAVFAAVLLAVSPAPALAEGNYSVRNGTSRAFSCGLRYERRSVVERFLLRSGTEWRRASQEEGPRVLMCDSYKFTQRWQVVPGVSYLLVEGRGGRAALRTEAPSN